MADWNPQLYLRYKAERTQPSRDLVARIKLENPESIIDLGCGPGNSTQILVERWPHADIIGLDKSLGMIEKAMEDYPNQKWILGDAANMEENRKYDLVFSNATLQWIPNHHLLMPKLFKHVNPNGVMAVQLPANQNSPLHQLLIATSRRRKWSDYTEGVDKLLTYNSAGFYYDVFSEFAQNIAVWETVYHHIYNSHQDLIEFYRSTAMKPILERLPNDSAKNEFEKELLSEYQKIYPVQRDGKILGSMKRLFIVAGN
jgi:trans-aconitate 2-methyltransferase